MDRERAGRGTGKSDGLITLPEDAGDQRLGRQTKRSASFR